DDGNRYISEAVNAGCVAVLTDIYDPFLENVTQLISQNVAGLEADLVAQFYGGPSDSLFTVGITGTNGKTITSYLVKHLLEQFDGSVGLVGTVEYIVGRSHYAATRTTPDISTNHKLLREMVMNDCKAAVMEVTSHGLDQGRVANIDFDVAIFTNLSLDHLDYHGDMDAYCAAKAKLFQGLGKTSSKKVYTGPKFAVVNREDPRSGDIVKDCQATVLWYGFGKECDVRAENVELSHLGTEFDLVYQGQRQAVKWPLIGRFNVYNYLAAASVGICRGWALKDVVKALDSFEGVKGRLQEVPNRLGVQVLVDFAHTDDALRNVLECLTEVQKGRIITVFGCGGCRDRSKRPKMAAAAEKYSSFVIVTSDNPRLEAPEAICAEIAQGFSSKEGYCIEPDRRLAIRKAVEEADLGDIVLIAGKGHECYQVFAHETIEFDDVREAQRICEEVAEERTAFSVV
ncbi:MAG: UDP-N-acetylmuramoyl-L-alanyl-D-glutamate--2,6-diaminopimelate ligase, partial [Chlamydiia bacterium]|nr:UDP-N-acetylmuramoyl-L-alanyl-D-glutamate--2,6-diaminopimelate ligase [Chlamydiia bacterium]